MRNEPDRMTITEAISLLEFSNSIPLSTLTTSQVEYQYRIQARKLHPDKNKAPDANEQFQKLGLAKKIILSYIEFLPQIYKAMTIFKSFDWEVAYICANIIYWQDPLYVAKFNTNSLDEGTRSELELFFKNIERHLSTLSTFSKQTIETNIGGLKNKSNIYLPESMFWYSTLSKMYEHNFYLNIGLGAIALSYFGATTFLCNYNWVGTCIKLGMCYIHLSNNAIDSIATYYAIKCKDAIQGVEYTYAKEQCPTDISIYTSTIGISLLASTANFIALYYYSSIPLAAAITITSSVISNTSYIRSFTEKVFDHYCIYGIIDLKSPSN